MKVMSLQEAADFTRRTPRAVRSLVLRRKIPFRKLAGRLIFIEAEIQAWIEKAPGVHLENIKKGD